MTILSKFFEEHIRHRKCQGFLHRETCRKHLTNDIVLFALSNFKYFAPICLLPPLIKIKSINKKQIRRTLEYYLGCSVMGAIIGFSTNLLICLIRNTRGHFGYYSFAFLPALISAFPLYLGPRRVIHLFETTIFQCIIETFFLMRKNIISRSIANSKILQTFLFMTCSATIMHVKQKYNTKEFWLLVPNTKKYFADNSEKCSECDLHPQSSCKQYLSDGMHKYFLMGLSLDFIKMLLSPVTFSENQSKFIGKLKKFHVRSMVLLTAYVGIYRFANCWLNCKGYYSDTTNHNLSSFLAGSCYYFYPQPSLFSFAIVQGIRSIWKIFETSYFDGKNRILRLILSIPYAKIVYPFALASLIHLVVLQPKYVSHLTTTVVNGIANKYTVEIQNEIKLLRDKCNL